MANKAAFPRLEFAQLTKPLRDLLSPIVDRVGYFGDFFAVLGRNPEALEHFMGYTKAVKAPLSDRQNEVLALTVCTRTGADYERIQHEWLSQRLGFSRAWIGKLTERPEFGPCEIGEEEVDLIALVDAVLRNGGRGAHGEVETVRRRLGETATLAAVLQIARFQMIATLSHAFDLNLPRASPLDS